MSTPHRGLPPPAAMTLPSPTQSSNSGLGQLPQPWQGSEESLRTWLQTKMEEERRRAEEERTRQEQQRGETRKIELEMLREAVRAGIPLPLVPLIFTGPGQVRTASGDWIGEYVAQNMALIQPQQGQQQQIIAQHSLQQGPPQSPQGQTLRREQRQIQTLHQQQPGVQPPAGQQMGPPVGVAGGPPPGYLPPYQISGPGGPPRAGGPPPQGQPPPTAQQSVPPLRAALPRINTTEMPITHAQPPMPPNVPIQAVGPHGPPMPSAVAQTAPSQAETQPVSQSPSIFFHHWVPPNTQTGGSAALAQAAASPQRQLDSPFSHHPPPNPLSGPDYANSPKKRKTNTGQQAQGQQPPPPSSSTSGQPFSPPTHPTSSAATTPSRTRRGHSRHRSETSNVNVRGFEPYARPSTRQRKSLAEGSMSEMHPGSGQQVPISAATGDSGAGQSRSSQGQRQQSAPPPHQPQQSQQRPYSAGSDFRTEPYPLSRPPSKSESGEGTGQAKGSGT